MDSSAPDQTPQAPHVSSVSGGRYSPEAMSPDDSSPNSRASKRQRTVKKPQEAPGSEPQHLASAKEEGKDPTSDQKSEPVEVEPGIIEVEIEVITCDGCGARCSESEVRSGDGDTDLCAKCYTASTRPGGTGEALAPPVAVGGDALLCSSCGLLVPEAGYSKNQANKPAAKRRCKLCVPAHLRRPDAKYAGGADDSGPVAPLLVPAKVRALSAKAASAGPSPRRVSFTIGGPPRADEDGSAANPTPRPAGNAAPARKTRPDERVTVWNRITKRKITGMAAPMVRSFPLPQQPSAGLIPFRTAYICHFS
jgi:hypothetical protein